jgi:glycosyltransferase involved in cell wall biosynthesis
MERRKDKLKICLLTYRGNPYCGGQGIYVQYLAQELVRLGHEVHVLSGPPYPVGLDGARLHRVSNEIFFGHSTGQILSRTPARALLSPLNLYEFLSSRLGVFPEIRAFSFRAYARLRKLLREHAFDVLHDNQCLGYGFLLMKHFRIPLVATIHHPLTIDRRTWFEGPSRLRQKMRMVLYYPLVMQRIVAHRLDRIVTVSEDAAARIRRDFGVPGERLRVVYNGLDADVFTPIHQQPKVPNRLLFVGNVADRKKGVLYLLQAMARLGSEVHLVLVDGGTPARVSAQDLIGQFGLEGRVQITGKIDRDELVRLYASAQVAIVPSLYEGFGFPAAEAMACQLPVVATTAGALPEVVGPPGEAALLVPPRDPDALAQAIRSLLDDPDRCRRMGAAGRRRVLRMFTWRRAAQRLVDVYGEVMGAHHQS